VNLTHVETPLEPLAASRNALLGKAQVDLVLHFLQSEFPEAFGSARVRSYGLRGIRQTRWIAGRQQLTVDDVRSGTNFPDAIARTSWPIELHDLPKVTSGKRSPTTTCIMCLSEASCRRRLRI
jgi:FAD dependent oxidoreductase